METITKKTQHYFELTEEQKLFVRTHTRMTPGGIGNRLKISSDRVRRYRKELQQPKAA